MLPTVSDGAVLGAELVSPAGEVMRVSSCYRPVMVCLRINRPILFPASGDSVMCSGQVTPANRPRAPVRATWSPVAESSCCEPIQRRDPSEPLTLSPFPSSWLGSASYVRWPGTLSMFGSSLSFYLCSIPCRVQLQMGNRGKGASSHSLPWSGTLGFLSGDLLIQLVSENLPLACQALRVPPCYVPIKIVVSLQAERTGWPLLPPGPMAPTTSSHIHS